MATQVRAPEWNADALFCWPFFDAVCAELTGLAA